MTLSYIVTTSDALTKRLNALLNALENPKGLWERIGFAMAESTRMRLSVGEDVDGSPFIPSIRALEEGGQTLRDTGRLFNSISYKATARGAQWGVSDAIPYAWVLNEGATITAKNGPYLHFKVGGRLVKKNSVTIPRRQFLGFGKSDQDEVTDIISSFLKGK